MPAHILPLSRQGHGMPRRSSRSKKLPLLIRRIFHPPTLDFETAIWEIIYLIIAPRKVYKSLYYHKQTKNTWARDDPSFIILLSSFLCLSAIAWGLAYSPGILSVFRLMIYMVGVDFLLSGVIMATVGWLFANRFLKTNSSTSSISSPSVSSGGRGAGGSIGVGVSGTLEWAYCFDVHCNSFLIVWLGLYIVEFILLPVLTRQNWFSLFLGNTLYFAVWCQYFVITFMGYSNMPFLEHTELLLFPIPILLVLYFVSLFGFSIVRTMLRVYFNA